MVRAILKLQAQPHPRSVNAEESLLEGGGEGDSVPGFTEKRRFCHLLSHKSDFLADNQRREDLQLVYSEVEQYLGEQDTPPFQTFVEILGRLYINGFEICDERMNSYGWGVFLGPSIMDHSCQPSATVSFKGNRLTVTCARPADDLSEVFISYCDTKLPTHLRREKLLRNYFFKCICSKCVHSARGSAKEDSRKRNKGKK